MCFHNTNEDRFFCKFVLIISICVESSLGVECVLSLGVGDLFYEMQDLQCRFSVRWEKIVPTISAFQIRFVSGVICLIEFSLTSLKHCSWPLFILNVCESRSVRLSKYKCPNIGIISVSTSVSLTNVEWTSVVTIYPLLKPHYKKKYRHIALTQIHRTKNLSQLIPNVFVCKMS